MDTHDFTARNLTKAGYAENPLENDDLAEFALHTGRPDRDDRRGGQGVRSLPQGRRPRQEHVRARPAVVDVRPPDRVHDPVPRRSGSPRCPTIRDANVTAFNSGWNFGETTETFIVSYEVKPAPMAPGTYRNITGNLALAYGLVAGGVQSGLPVFLGSYPITPASDILHELSKHKSFGVTTFQAEDEIAGIGAAIGAAFAGSLGVTTTSGPGISLKGESIGLAVMTELPAARGQRPARRPVDRAADQDRAVRPAAGDVRPQRRVARPDRRAAVTRRLLRRGPRGHPDRGDLPDPGDAALRRDARQRLRAVADPRHRRAAGDRPGLRGRGRTPARSSCPTSATRTTLARPWAIPGTAGLEHRIGGLEKGDGHGNISYDPANHDFMVRTRQAKVDRIADSLPPLEVDDPTGAAKVLVLGWGSTYGPIGAGVRRVRKAGYHVAQAHLRHLNPFPKDLGEILARYDRVLVPEMNLGQLSLLLRAKYLVDVVGYNHVRGLPLKAAELADAIGELVAEAEGVDVDLTGQAQEALQ